MTSTERTPDGRLGWDEYFLGIAEAVSRRGDCTRSQVGAVAVDEERRIVSTGYNGVAAGDAGCLLDGVCPRGRHSYEEQPSGGDYADCIARHAEWNCLEYLGAWSGYMTMYVTRPPCAGCLQKIFGEFEFSRVVWPGGGEVSCDN